MARVCHPEARSAEGPLSKRQSDFKGSLAALGIGVGMTGEGKLGRMIVRRWLSAMAVCLAAASALAAPDKPRARDLGVPFEGTPGPLNAITDVRGVEVGHTTLIRGEGKLERRRGPRAHRRDGDRPARAGCRATPSSRAVSRLNGTER